jgi:enolase
MIIKKVDAREILDSRGNPTIECLIELKNGKLTKASAPSGASTGQFESLELRDGDKKRFGGKGVLKAIDNIKKLIAPIIVNHKPDLLEIDKKIITLDGTQNKSHLGANATIAVSMAVARAQAIAENCELYELLRKISKTEKSSIPLCMFNIINGGVHANSGLAFQEFMIMPLNAKSMLHTIEITTAIYRKLKEILNKDGYSTAVGDEGGFAPQFKSIGFTKELDALSLLVKATSEAGYTPGHDVAICTDIAASTFYDENSKIYNLHGKKLTSASLIDLYEELINTYPIISIEDGLSEEDWDGWQKLTNKLGSSVQLVGDDIFTTNTKRIQNGIDLHVSNAVLIKPNQIGTVTETLNAISLCKQNGLKTVVSHRSGETTDTFIADLAFGTNSGQIKTGACTRGERVAKYNRLLEIETNAQQSYLMNT